MITRFSTLYVGHIELESCGLSGTPADDRRYSNDRLVEAFTTADALARAAGVPAREVSGLMYMGDDVRAFGAHAWNEVVLDGRWVPVDPTWNETELDAAHVTLDRDGHSSAMMETLGRLTFRVQALDRAP